MLLLASSAPAVAAPRDLEDETHLRSRLVHLITGDRVHVHRDGAVTIVPRTGVTFTSQRLDGRHRVIPSDAWQLLADGRLDPRLFDVTELLGAAAGRPGALPLIIEGNTAMRGLAATGTLPAVGGFAATIDDSRLAATWPQLRDSLTAGRIWLDAWRTPTLDVSVPLVGAPTAWAAGYDGTGTKVAVLDTGVDTAHPDLADRVVLQRNFTGGMEDDLDRVGHGTHVASIIAGSGAASDGDFKGVAPGARLLDGKVCVVQGCAESMILAGMQWAAESGADVVNLSLGGFNGPETDPLERAVDELTEQYGVLFVAAAGNSGGDGTLNSPASAVAALAVGATTKTDTLAEFSSRGPSADGFAVKPDLSGPGVAIMAARSKDGLFGKQGDQYTALSGTSMATPHAAAAAAIVAQAHPTWSPAELKAALMASAAPHPQVGVFAQGAGRVDAGRAIGQQLIASPPVVSFGMQPYPHEDDEIRSATIVYHNSGTAPAELHLTMSGDAPPGMFTLSTSAVTVQAGADTSVVVSADTRVGGDASGGLGVRIIAQGEGGVRVHTPVGVVREKPTHTVRVTMTQRDGTPVPDDSQAVSVLTNTGTGEEFSVLGDGGELRVPAGEYFAWSRIMEGRRDDPDALTMLTRPRLTIAGPTELIWAASQGKLFDVTVPDTTARLAFGSYTVIDRPRRISAAATVVGGRVRFYSAQLGPREVDGLHSAAVLTFGKPDRNGEFGTSPYYYHVGRHSTGTAMEGLTARIGAGDVATVHSTYAKRGAAADDAVGFRSNFLRFADDVPHDTLSQGFPLPLRRTEHFSGDAPWQSVFVDATMGNDTSLIGARTDHRAGGVTREHWNRAVSGPTMMPDELGTPPIQRVGDLLVVRPSMTGDGDGHHGSAFLAGSAALYRDGVLIGDQPAVAAAFEVPPGRGRYRLVVVAERGSRLSPRVEAEWTFMSSAGEGVVPVPASAVGFAAPVDDRNVGRRASVAVVPIVISRSGAAGRVRVDSVEVSHDGGLTWRRARVAKVFGSWIAIYRHPAGPGQISLRAAAADDQGNTVRVTILRAYDVA
ncbi:S8 family serine peptidase [Catellatospora aurea]|uniref:S8 family serine peptidase n=1 Tax=Catellatospora aurea TaxID=1337874 RepID=A0ABW2H6B0_9ACTN